MEMKEALEYVFSKGESRLAEKVLAQKPEKADAIIVFTGYGPKLSEKAAELWKDGYSKQILIFGPDSWPWKSNPEANADFYKTLLVGKYKIPKENIYSDPSEQTRNTKNCSIMTLQKVLENKWEKIIFVVAGYHQTRAYMTFVKTLVKAGLEKRIKIIAAAYVCSDWLQTDEFLEEPWVDALKVEAKKIEEYGKRGDLCSWEELGNYLKIHKL